MSPSLIMFSDRIRRTRIIGLTIVVACTIAVVILHKDWEYGRQDDRFESCALVRSLLTVAEQRLGWSYGRLGFLDNYFNFIPKGDGLYFVEPLVRARNQVSIAFKPAVVWTDVAVEGSYVTERRLSAFSGPAVSSCTISNVHDILVRTSSYSILVVHWRNGNLWVFKSWTCFRKHGEPGHRAVPLQSDFPKPQRMILIPQTVFCLLILLSGGRPAAKDNVRAANKSYCKVSTTQFSSHFPYLTCLLQSFWLVKRYIFSFSKLEQETMNLSKRSRRGNKRLIEVHYDLPSRRKPLRESAWKIPWTTISQSRLRRMRALPLWFAGRLSKPQQRFGAAIER